MCACVHVCVCVFCALVGLDNKLYKMHRSYIKIVESRYLQTISHAQNTVD